MSNLNLKLQRGERKLGIHIRVRPDTHDKIEQIAKSNDVPVAAVYRAIIDFYFDRPTTECTHNRLSNVSNHVESA